MQDNLANQQDFEPLIQQQIPQQNLPQNYIPPTPNNQPNIQQSTNQPTVYVAQANSQPYIVQQGVYGTQNLTQSKDINSKHLQHYLIGPIIWTWSMFLIYLIIGSIILIKFGNHMEMYGIVITLIPIIGNFVIALLVSLSIRKGNVKIYKCARYLYLVYFLIIVAVTIILTIIFSKGFFGGVVIFPLLLLCIIESITLMILCCSKKESDMKQISN